MAKRRSTKNMPAGLARYWRKKQRKSHHPKKKRRAHSTMPKKRRRKSHTKKHRRRHSGGGSTGLIPNRHEAYALGGAALYGFLESKAKADPEFIMNKIPRPIAQLGYAGNIALIARLVNKYVFKHPGVRMLSNAAGLIAAYKIGAKGELFTQADTIEGDDEMEGDYFDAPDIGALAAEGEMAGDDMEGDSYDNAVEDAGAHT